MIDYKKGLTTLSATDVINTLENRHLQDVQNVGDSSLTGSQDFTGTESAEEYIELYRYGWKEGRDSLKASVKELVHKTKPLLDNSVVGFMPNIPEYLGGNPENMHTLTYSIDKVINIVVPLGWNGGVDSNDILKYGGAVATVLKALVDGGYKVNLKMINGAQYSDGKTERRITIIDVVKVGDVLDIDKIASCFHTSFFRRGMFAVWEMSQDSIVKKHTNSGYGSAWKLDKDVVEACIDSNEEFMLFPPLHHNPATEELVQDAINEVKKVIA